MRWVGPVCNGPPGCGDRPLGESFLPRRQPAPNSFSGIPDDRVEMSLPALGGALDTFCTSCLYTTGQGVVTVLQGVRTDCHYKTAGPPVPYDVINIIYVMSLQQG